jgi:SAM-dependent methyltransferase
MGLRKSLWFPFFGVPRGPLGSVGARVMPFMVRPLYAMMAGELALQPDDELLEVGCGSALLLAEQASHVRHVAGLDVSEIQVDMARRRLADRIAAGTAEVVLGDALALPWEDGRFSAVSCLNCLKFVSDPRVALREMARVLRPGGRAVLTFDEDIKDPARSGTIDAFGQWQWSANDARRMMEEAGFAEVSVTRTPTRIPFQLLRGVKRAAPAVAEAIEATETAALAEAAVR